jgi:hypothetical protein
LREKRKLRVFENRVLRQIFGVKMDEVTAEWRKLHNNDLYSSSYIIQLIKSRKNRWAGHVAHTGRVLYRVLEGKSERPIQL